MITLRDLQRRCYDAFIGGDTQALLPFVCSDHIAADARIQVYQNNAREVFTKTLGSSYPVIAMLVGDDCFRTLAQDYLRRQPSSSGDLSEFGKEFPALLDAYYDGTAFEYLVDVAHLEWACEEVRVAADADAADLAQLQESAGESFGSLRFALHPAVRVIGSRFPVFSIWHGNIEGDDTEIDLARGGEDVLVRRRAGAEVTSRADLASDIDSGAIELRSIDSMTWRVLERLELGVTLLEALTDALSSGQAGIDAGVTATMAALPAGVGDADPVEVLRRIAQLRVLVTRAAPQLQS